jgi:hypothetical protein
MPHTCVILSSQLCVVNPYCGATLARHGFQYLLVTSTGNTGFAGGLNDVVGLEIHTNVSTTGTLLFGGPSADVLNGTLLVTRTSARAHTHTHTHARTHARTHATHTRARARARVHSHLLHSLSSSPALSHTPTHVLCTYSSHPILA